MNPNPPGLAREKRFFFIYGVNAVKEKLASSTGGVLQVLIAEGSRRESLQSIEQEARRRRVPVRHLSAASLTDLAATQKHQGVVAKVRSYDYGSFERLLEKVSDATGPNWILAIDSLTDPRNLGAVFRTAEAVGVRDVILPKDRVTGVTAATVKASAGAVFHMAVYRVVNLHRALLRLKEKGYWVVGLDVAGDQMIYKQPYPQKLVVVLGAEGAGLRPLIRSACDFLVSIPMSGNVSSLNVAVATGVFLYELARRKEFL